MTDEQNHAPRITPSGGFHLNLHPVSAFKLFTAVGERLWVPGWTPTFLGPLPQQTGLVFTTGTGADYTIWTVIETDAANGRLRYSRVTPGSRAGLVAVQVLPDNGGTWVQVSYDLTALSPEGERALDSYSPDRFAEMMAKWLDLIVSMPDEVQAGLTTLIV